VAPAAAFPVSCVLSRPRVQSNDARRATRRRGGLGAYSPAAAKADWRGTPSRQLGAEAVRRSLLERGVAPRPSREGGGSGTLSATALSSRAGGGAHGSNATELIPPAAPAPDGQSTKIASLEPER